MTHKHIIAPCPLADRLATRQVTPRMRQAGLPTDRTLRHTLAVSELYVCVVDQGRAEGVVVAVFDAEPGCWWPNGLGGYIKPDAYLVLESGSVREHTWVEVDLATESLPAYAEAQGAALLRLRASRTAPAS